MDKLYKISEDIESIDLFGNLDCNLRLIEEATGVEIVQRDNGLVIVSHSDAVEPVSLATMILDEYVAELSQTGALEKQKASYIVNLAKEGVSYSASKLGKDVICFTHAGKPLKPKTLGQKEYVNAIRKHDIVFGVGPAGTGKTYIAVAMAINAYRNKEVQKIILARPAVEAGERLGFLPGDLQEKVDPYLRPLYDALHDVLGRDQALRLKEKEVIEVVPLAYMRGRTLDNSFIILDEAQNTTREQMKMFLTRMGFGSKVVVTGDITQIDLPRGKKSGLVEAKRVLSHVKEIAFCELKDTDVVRHELVRKIVNAYDEYYRKNPEEVEE